MKNVPKDFTLDHKWPTGLPTQCEHCDNPYDKRFTLEVGPGRLGRFLRKIAPWLSVVMLVLMLTPQVKIIHPVVTGSLFPLLFLVLFLPSLVLYLIGGFLPIKSRLYCYKCDRASYFNPPHEWSGTAEDPLTDQTRKSPGKTEAFEN